MRRLGIATLDTLPANAKPALDPRGVTVGIVHLGLGAFHRAHQAVYTQAAMVAGGDMNWGICGVTQRSRDVIDQLGPQDGLYTVLERGPRSHVAVQAPLREILFARDDTDALLARIAAVTTHVVTLTVTEKGYRHDPASGRLRRDDPETNADAAGRSPHTVVGQLVRAIQARAGLDHGPLTIVCCDNLPHNGATLRGLVHDFCELLPAAEGASLHTWIADNVTFPATMVDRIVPATTAADRHEVAESLGVEDFGAVVAEPFSQWVIEDNFAAVRPAWHAAGATFTDDVAPYEAMKLRLLNGSHSALAYLGVLAGAEYVAEFVVHDEVRQFVRLLMDADVTPTLAVPNGFDLTGYKDALLQRFANPALHHRTQQIAMDGSQKLPQRLLGVVRERIAAGAEPRAAILAVAAWMRFVSARRTDAGAGYGVDDPLAPRIADALRSAASPAAVVDGLLAFTDVFGDLAESGNARALLVEALGELTRAGALGAVRDLVSVTAPAPRET